MARITQDDFSGQTDAEQENKVEIDALGQDSIEVPNNQFISDSDISRDGQDLILEAPSGQTVVIQNYFNGDQSPLIESPDGSILTENLVNSFLNSDPQFAQVGSLNDVSPVGAVEEITGEATVIRTDGTSEPLALGTPIYQGDTIETTDSGAVNIVFIDETSMAVSENARLSVDEYQFDPSTESGETNLSVLRGVFVFTSGLIGRDDPDDVMIDTPVGSIGIRGTIIAGKINPGGESEITVVEGAIVVKNGAMETTLSQQYESVRLGGFNDNMQDIGVQQAQEVGKTYGSVSDVVPKLFSSINDNIKQESQNSPEETKEPVEDILDTEEEILDAEPELPQEEIVEPVTNLDLGNTFENDLNDSKQQQSEKEKERRQKEERHKKGNEKEASENLENEQLNPELYTEQPLNIDTSPIKLFEGMKSGAVIGKVFSEGGAAGSTSFKFSNGTTVSDDTYFEITQIGGRSAEIKLTVAGKIALDGTSIGSALSSPFTVVITDQNGEKQNIHLDPPVLDAVVNLTTPGGLHNFDVNHIGPIAHPQRVGDLNGDGHQDHVNIGAGTVTLVDGSTTAPMGSTLTGATGVNPNSVDGVGDVNNDGYADVVYGAHDTANGTVKLVNGSSGGFSTNTPTNGTAAGDQLGYSVSGIGDFDGDGKSDYAYSALNENNGSGGEGVVYFELSSGGTPTIGGLTAGMQLGEHIDGLGDINGDGLSDVIIAAKNQVAGNYEAYIIRGENTLSVDDTGDVGITTIRSPHQIVAGGAAGDLNGDGFDDIAVSLDDGTHINTYVIFGGTSLPPLIDMTYLEDPNNALKIHHAGVGGAPNYQVTALSDVNGDGFDDIQLGVDGGEQFVVHGSLAGNAPYVMDNAPNDGDNGVGKIQATANDQSLVGDTHFIDNAYTGLSMKGGDGRNDFSIQNNQFRKIDGGNGVEDTIRYGTSGGGGTLDFSSVDFEKIEQIERIHFSKDSDTIRLTAENIFNLLKTSDNGSLTIELGSSGGAASTNATLEIDDLNGVSGATIHDQIVNTLNEDGTGATYNGVNGDGNHHYQIGGYDLYIENDANLTIAVV